MKPRRLLKHQDWPPHSKGSVATTATPRGMGTAQLGRGGGAEIRYPESSSRVLTGCRGRIPALPYLPPGPGAERDPPRQAAHVPQALRCCASQHLETPQPSQAPASHLHPHPVTMFRKEEKPGGARLLHRKGAGPGWDLAPVLTPSQHGCTGETW